MAAFTLTSQVPGDAPFYLVVTYVFKGKGLHGPIIQVSALERSPPGTAVWLDP